MKTVRKSKPPGSLGICQATPVPIEKCSLVNFFFGSSESKSIALKPEISKEI